MFIFKCTECNKTWRGKDEHHAEVKAELNPCKCSIKANQMSLEELKKEIANQQKGGSK